MRKLGLALLGAAALAGSSAASAAIEFTGSTLGCFGAGCTPVASTSFFGLSFTGGSFDQFTSPLGFVGIGGQPGGDTLGTLSQDGSAFNYTGTAFSLLVNFTAPTITGGTFSALLSGDVGGANNGGVRYNFANPTQTFNYAGGSFTLTVDSGTVAGTNVNKTISGFIISSVPEPATWAMMLVGFGGIGLAMRRRRTPALAQLA